MYEAKAVCHISVDVCAWGQKVNSLNEEKINY